MQQKQTFSAQTLALSVTAAELGRAIFGAGQTGSVRAVLLSNVLAAAAFVLLAALASVNASRPNEGLRIDPVEQARRIREAEQNDPVLRGRVIQGIADPAIFDESRGESIAAMMERSPNFLHWMPGDHTRLAGKMQFHYRLAFDGEGKPMFQVFNTCKHFIRTIPNLVYDESNVEDIDTRQEDHIYDECRYVLMEKPISPPRRTVRPPQPDDPLELHQRARFYRI